MANLVIIRNLCQARKMTLVELARKIGRDVSTIQTAIRRGSTNTTTLEQIAKALNVSPSIFYDGNNDVNLIKEIEHLKALVAEKERTIEILINSRKGI